MYNQIIYKGFIIIDYRESYIFFNLFKNNIIEYHIQSIITQKLIKIFFQNKFPTYLVERKILHN